MRIYSGKKIIMHIVTVSVLTICCIRKMHLPCWRFWKGWEKETRKPADIPDTYLDSKMPYAVRGIGYFHVSRGRCPAAAHHS